MGCSTSRRTTGSTSAAGSRPRDTSATNVAVYLNRSTPGALRFRPIVVPLGEAARCYNCVNETDLQAVDVDNDGAPDLVASLSANDAVFVSFNDLRGPSKSFLPPVRVAVGQDPVWVRVGDFDGDSVNDLATINLERKLVVSDVWSLTFVPGGGRTFGAAKTLVLGDADRLGFTDRNDVSPYERHETDFTVARLPLGAPGGQDALVTSGILIGAAPRIWFIPPGGSQFQRSPQDLSLAPGPGLYALTGTAPFAFFSPGFSLIGPGSLTAGAPGTIFKPDWSVPGNTPLAAFVTANFGTLGRLESFHLADFDGDGQIDTVARFSNASLVGFGRGLRAHPFEPLVGGGGEVQTIAMSARRDDQPLFHSLVIGDFDGDRNLDILSAGMGIGGLAVYRGAVIAQAGPVMLTQVMPATTKEGGRVSFTGTGLLAPSPATVATLTQVGGAARWRVPIQPADIPADTTLNLTIPMLGDDGFWRRNGPTINVDVVVENACNTSAPAVRIQVSQGP